LNDLFLGHLDKWTNVNITYVVVKEWANYEFWKNCETRSLAVFASSLDLSRPGEGFRSRQIAPRFMPILQKNDV